MHAAAQIDQPLRTFDQRGQHVGREHIHRQDLGVSFRRRSPIRLAVDAGVVDDGIHAADLVDLLGE